MTANPFKKFIFLLRELLNNSRKTILFQQETFALNQINQLFNNNNIYIPFTIWSLAPSTILHVLNDIVINKRKVIVEFGSGASTLYIAQLIKTQMLDIEFISVETSENWEIELNSILNNYGLNEYVKIIYAPIKKVENELAYKEQKKWYSTDVLEKEFDKVNEIDLILVDGPSGSCTPFARYSAIPFLKGKLSNTLSVFLDDTNRTEETEIFIAWKNYLGGNIKKMKRYSYLHQGDRFNGKPFGATNFS